MINKIAFFVLFVLTSFATFGQSTEATAKTGRPNIPGTFVMELGFNRDLTGPDNFSLNFWGSRTLNIYYQYELPILKSKISFVPGIGVSLERYRFKNERTLAYTKDDVLQLVTPALLTSKDSIASFVPTGVIKSKLITNYLEVPLEFRYTSKPDDPARAFKISVGGRVGYLFESFTKLKYKENHEVKHLKNKQDFNLNQLRYGVSAKVGFGNFSLFAYYNLTNLFQDGKGPYLKGTDGTYMKDDFPTATFGISLSSF